MKNLSQNSVTTRTEAGKKFLKKTTSMKIREIHNKNIKEVQDKIKNENEVSRISGISFVFHTSSISI